MLLDYLKIQLSVDQQLMSMYGNFNTANFKLASEHPPAICVCYRTTGYHNNLLRMNDGIISLQ
jgi:hypothetical protein